MGVLYFAYGSNMQQKRLRSRIGPVKVKSRAFLRDWQMVFNKRSIDGSGKANLVESPGAVTWGVLYEIDAQDFKKLDGIEGGYDRVPVRVWTPDGNAVEAVTYISTNITDDPRPYKRYKDLLISGARENGLPGDYIAYIESFPEKTDENTTSVNSGSTHKDTTR